MRGKDLEKTILELFKHYKEKGIFCMRIHEHRLGTGVVVEKSPFDFLVYHDGTVYGFDTKECAGDTVNIKTNFKTHQIEAMLEVMHNGGQGFFLIYFFKHTMLCKITADTVLELMKQGRKSVGPEDCQPTSLDILGALS